MITVAPDIRSIVDADGAVVLDIRHNAITPLDAVGGYVWQRLERGIPVEKIVTELALESEMNEAAIATDVAVFLKQLLEKHLIVADLGDLQGAEGKHA